LLQERWRKLPACDDAGQEDRKQDAYATRLAEAEPLMRRALEILRRFGEQTGHEHPHMQQAMVNYWSLLAAMGLPEAEIERRVALEARGGGTGDVEIEQRDEMG
jgi:type II secretory pathway predicted ATPase ExeA